MQFPLFTLGSARSKSPVADAERTVNLVPFVTDSPAARNQVVLYPSPGQQPYFALTDAGTRGGFSMKVPTERSFAVVGGGFWELFPLTRAKIRRGAVLQNAFPATISTNGEGQLLITSGGAAYLYDLATNVLTLIAGLAATMGGCVDGFGLAFDLVSGQVRISDFGDLSVWDPTQFFARSAAPDPWQAMAVNDREIYMIGEQTGEIWYNAGTAPVPFALSTGSLFGYGTGAPFSVAVRGGAVTWLAQSKGGGGTIVLARGPDPQAISSEAVNDALARALKTSTISDTETFCYEEEDHLYSCVSCPTAQMTWVHDAKTNLWHERGTWNAPQNRYDAWHPRTHFVAAGKHFVGERGSTVISELTDQVCVEADGGPLRRMRVGPALWAQYPELLIVDRFEVILESGLADLAGQGQDPLVALRYSKDAKTWSYERTARAGRRGDYGQRAFFTQCGSSEKLWLPEIVMTDPVPWRILDAEIEGEGFLQMRAA